MHKFGNKMFSEFCDILVEIIRFSVSTENGNFQFFLKLFPHFCFCLNTTYFIKLFQTWQIQNGRFKICENVT